MDTYAKVCGFVREYRMIEPEDVVLAAVSGGGDSMAMLHMLEKLRREIEFELRAVHVHHGIRTEEAERDLRLVEDYCRERKIACRVYRYDVPGLAGQWKMGHEETGRCVRREVFEKEGKASEQEGKRMRIALAHNLNDQAETMLHHLARGTGIRGLAGIRAVSGNIIRPVLCLERKEIDHYLVEEGIFYIQDSTNLKDDYTRNRIRHHILPLLEQEVNVKTVVHMANAAQTLKRAEDYLVQQSRLLLENCVKEEGYLFGQAFFETPDILQEYAVLEALEALAGKRRDISAVHVRQVRELYKKQTGSRIVLPYRITAGREYEGVLLKRDADEKRDQAGEETEWQLLVPGRLECVLGAFETENFFYQGEKISEKKYTKWFDYDKIENDLTVRTRRAGDFLVVNREGNHKKLTRCMIDEKIPREDRNVLPLVVCGREVLWMVGGRMNERYKVTPETRRVLVLKYQGGNRNERKSQGFTQ